MRTVSEPVITEASQRCGPARRGRFPWAQGFYGDGPSGIRRLHYPPTTAIWRQTVLMDDDPPPDADGEQGPSRVLPGAQPGSMSQRSGAAGSEDRSGIPNGSARNRLVLPGSRLSHYAKRPRAIKPRGGAREAGAESLLGLPGTYDATIAVPLRVGTFHPIVASGSPSPGGAARPPADRDQEGRRPHSTASRSVLAKWGALGPAR